MRFTKMQGIGNDFVMVDALRDPLPEDLPSFAKLVTDRHRGVGADGLILLERGEAAPYRMRMYNPDGSLSEMCGNGVRCLARFIRENGHSEADRLEVETGAGVLQLDFLPEGIRVEMGAYRLLRGEIGMSPPSDETFIEQPIEEGVLGTAVSMGNPHLVVFVSDVSKVDLGTLGPRYEKHSLFPDRTNVHFVQVLDRETLLMRIWERGAGATLACGTGACAVAVAALVTGRAEAITTVKLPGGDLRIEIYPDRKVTMIGPAETVFTGEYGP